MFKNIIKFISKTGQKTGHMSRCGDLLTPDQVRHIADENVKKINDVLGTVQLFISRRYELLIKYEGHKPCEIIQPDRLIAFYNGGVYRLLTEQDKKKLLRELADVIIPGLPAHTHAELDLRVELMRAEQLIKFIHLFSLNHALIDLSQKSYYTDNGKNQVFDSSVYSLYERGDNRIVSESEYKKLKSFYDNNVERILKLNILEYREFEKIVSTTSKSYNISIDHLQNSKRDNTTPEEEYHYMKLLKDQYKSI